MNSKAVSVLCITYNHEKYIRDTLEGFISQKLNVPFKAYVADDHSTDKTPEIIAEYAKEYPNIIVPVLQPQNKGMIPNLLDCMRLQDGKYVAFCDGDDYWTDPLKLQKQKDYLDNHPDYSLCFHPVRFEWVDKSQKPFVYPRSIHLAFRKSFTYQDLLKRYFFQTSSVMFRWVYPNLESQDCFPNDIIAADWYLFLAHAKHGKIGMVNDCMSVYRKHPGGVWGKNAYIQHLYKNLHLWDEINKLFEYKEEKMVDHMKRRMILYAYNEAVKNEEMDIFNTLPIKYPRFMKQSWFQSFMRLCLTKGQEGIRERLLQRFIIIFHIEDLLIHWNESSN